MKQFTARGDANSSGAQRKDDVVTASLGSVELFAGAGGLALGLSNAGFSPVLVNDKDAVACKTLLANGQPPRSFTTGWPVIEGDVRKLDYSQHQGVALLSAGAPCQPFSQAGLGKGEADHRNMFDEVVRAARALKPKAFVLENVRGLLFKRSRAYFDFLIAELRMPSLQAGRFASRESFIERVDSMPDDERDYRVEWRLLNSADFGVPQSRVRLVVVGIRQDQGVWTWPEPTHSKDALIRELKADRYWERHEVPKKARSVVRAALPKSVKPSKLKRWRTVRDVTTELGPPSKNGDAKDPAHVLVPGARLYAKHSGSRLDWPGKTIKAGVHGPPGGEHIILDDAGAHRYLTVRECATLQGFPTEYQLPAKRNPAMRQLGNAVPVALAEAVGRQVAAVLQG